MKASVLILFALAAAAPRSLPAELPPALKSLAERFDQNCAALAASGEAQLAPVRDRYIAALSAAQKTAAAAAKTADLAALATELEGVRANSLPTDIPPDLPRALVTDRRNYVSTAATVARTVAPRQRDLATKYLQSLVALEADALKAKDAAGAEAVAGEKQRVLTLLEASGGGARHRNVIPNGDFSQGEDGAAPPGWKRETEVSVADAIIVSEGGNKFLRFRRIEALRRANLIPDKEILVPAKAKSADFSLRMRVKGLVPGKEWSTHPGVHVSGRDGRGEEVSKEDVEVKADTPWRRFTGRVELPATAKTLKVAIGPHSAAGIIDIDDIEVEFR